MLLSKEQAEKKELGNGGIEDFDLSSLFADKPSSPLADLMPYINAGLVVVAILILIFK